jgi:hypothetical protein
MFLHALVDHRLEEAIEFFATREEAEETLATVLLDEPDWAEQLEIVETDFSEFARPN